MTPAQLEKRVVALEAEVAKLKSKVEEMDLTKPWWERIAGTFHGDPVYEKAMQFGRRYRCSQNVEASSRRRK
ncbi:MAG: hypothetical protein ACYC3X_27980 [Pirellulaceae bacterium]